jgi:ribonuclease T
VSPVSELTARRFRGYLPIVIDVETGGFHSRTDALLELAAVIIQVDGSGRVGRGATHSWHVKPFEGSRLDPASLEVNGIDPWHPLRPAVRRPPHVTTFTRGFRRLMLHSRVDC